MGNIHLSGVIWVICVGFRDEEVEIIPRSEVMIRWSRIHEKNEFKLARPHSRPKRRSVGLGSSRAPAKLKEWR